MRCRTSTSTSTHGPLRAASGRPRRASPRRSRSSRAMPPTSSRATSPRSRPGVLLGELARTLGADAAAADGRARPPYLERQLLFPYSAGEAFGRACARAAGQRRLDRAFAPPPRTSAAARSARFLAGDPPAQAVGPLPARCTFATTFGAEDVAALTGRNGSGELARRPPRPLAAGPRRAPRDARRRAVAAALRRVLPQRRGRVPRPPRMRAHRARERFSAAVSCR